MLVQKKKKTILRCQLDARRAHASIYHTEGLVMMINSHATDLCIYYASYDYFRVHTFYL